MNTALEVLEKSREIVRKMPYLQRQTFNNKVTTDYPEGASGDQVCYCSLGAIREVLEFQPLQFVNYDSNNSRKVDRLYIQAESALAQAIRDTVGSVYKASFNTVTSFNDHPDTTKEDVEAMFTKAIELEKKRTE